MSFRANLFLDKNISQCMNHVWDKHENYTFKYHKCEMSVVHKKQIYKNRRIMLEIQTILQTTNVVSDYC